MYASSLHEEHSAQLRSAVAVQGDVWNMSTLQTVHAWHVRGALRKLGSASSVQSARGSHTRSLVGVGAAISTVSMPHAGVMDRQARSLVGDAAVASYSPKPQIVSRLHWRSMPSTEEFERPPTQGVSAYSSSAQGVHVAQSESEAAVQDAATYSSTAQGLHAAHAPGVALNVPLPHEARGSQMRLDVAVGTATVYSTFSVHERTD
jgi:hypothetical protein